jgi:hypothetical protein
MDMPQPTDHVSRRHVLTFGAGLTGALLAPSLGNIAVAQTAGSARDGASKLPQDTINDIQEIIQAEGMVSNGVLSIEIDRDDLLMSRRAPFRSNPRSR